MGAGCLLVLCLVASARGAPTAGGLTPTQRPLGTLLFMDDGFGSGDLDELPELTSTSRIEIPYPTEERQVTTLDEVSTQSASTWTAGEVSSEDEVTTSGFSMSTTSLPDLETTSEEFVPPTSTQRITEELVPHTTTQKITVRSTSSRPTPLSTTPPPEKDCICHQQLNLTVKLQFTPAITTNAQVFRLGEGRNVTLVCHNDGGKVNGSVMWVKLNDSLPMEGPLLELTEVGVEAAGPYICAVDCCPSRPLQLLIYPAPNYVLQIYVLGAAFAILVLLAVALTALRSFLVRRQNLTHFKDVSGKHRGIHS